MPRFIAPARCLLTFITLLALVAPASGQGNPFDQPPGGFPGQQQGGFGDSRDRVTVTARAAVTEVTAGSEVPVAVIFNHQPKWHTWAPAGVTIEGADEFDGAIHTQVKAEVPDDTPLLPHTSFIQWPEPHLIPMNLLGTPEPQKFAVMEGSAISYLPVTIAEDATPGEAVLTLKVTFQSCDDRTCLMPVYDHEITVAFNVVDGDPVRVDEMELTGAFEGFDAAVFEDVAAGTAPPGAVPAPPTSLTAPTPASGGLSAATLGGFLLILLFALIGGFILNLTPCVLPVIPLKIMGLAQSAGNRGRTFALGVAMSLGVIAFWMGIGVAIVFINGFTSTNQLFQYPIFTISIGVLIAILAVGMCGLFSIRLPAFVYSINLGHDSFHGSFLFGVMTAILSTPCTAPFMGSAAAAAVGQPSGLVLTVFGSIGLGMALPYMILSAYPKLVEKMPRTGPASELIKQLMGLFLLAAAAYFIGVGVSGILVTPPDPPSRLYWWPVFAFTAAAGGWLLVRTLQLAKSATPRTVFSILALLIFAASLYGGVRLSKHDKSGPIQWTYYTPEVFEQTLSDGKVILMDFTAEWCLNCKLLEKNILDSERVSGRIAEDDVAAIKVDLTGNNKLGNQKLNETGSVTIPWLVIFSPSGEVVFAQNWYTADQVLDAIERASVSTQVAAGSS